MDIGSIVSWIQLAIWVFALIIGIAKLSRGEAKMHPWLRRTLASNWPVWTVIALGLMMSGISLYLLRKAQVTVRTQTGIKYSEHDFLNDDSRLRYGLELTIETEKVLEPTSLIVTFEGEIAPSSDANLRRGDEVIRLMDEAHGYLCGNRKDMFAMKWRAPAWKPGDVLLVRLFSETRVRVNSMNPVHYYWP